MLALRGYGVVRNGADGGLLKNIISMLIRDSRVDLNFHGGDEVCHKHKRTRQALCMLRSSGSLAMIACAIRASDR